VWTGDQASLWEHLEMSLPLLLNLGLSGISFAGTDIGGFFEDCDGELLVRWTQLGALYPFSRNHSASDTAPQEPWAFGPDVEDACRRALELRYRLLPYVYGLFEEAARTGAPVLRPLFFHHASDARTHRIADQALLGRDLLLAPVLRPGVEQRSLYLPGGRWFDVRSGERHEGGRWISTAAPLDGELPLFARGGAIVPFGPVVQWADERPLDPLELHVFLDADGCAEGHLYEDDGGDESCETRFAHRAGELSSERSGRYTPADRSVQVTVHG
jgi:alpha-glucosidase